jgi:hypothetical protein
MKNQILTQAKNIEEIANGLKPLVDDSDINALLEIAADLKSIKIQNQNDKMERELKNFESFIQHRKEGSEGRFNQKINWFLQDIESVKQRWDEERFYESDFDNIIHHMEECKKSYMEKAAAEEQVGNIEIIMKILNQVEEE